MFEVIKRRIAFVGEVLMVSALILLTLIVLAHPAMAQVVSAPAAAPAVVQVQPFLHDALTIVGILVIGAIPIVATPVASAVAQHFHLKNEDVLRDALINLADQAAHFGLAFADNKAGKVGNIPVSNPVIAAAANWLLVHACDEIEHLDLSRSEVIGVAQAALAPYLNGTRGLPAPKSA